MQFSTSSADEAESVAAAAFPFDDLFAADFAFALAFPLLDSATFRFFEAGELMLSLPCWPEDAAAPAWLGFCFWFELEEDEDADAPSPAPPEPPSRSLARTASQTR